MPALGSLSAPFRAIKLITLLLPSNASKHIVVPLTSPPIATDVFVVPLEIATTSAGPLKIIDPPVILLPPATHPMPTAVDVSAVLCTCAAIIVVFAPIEICPPVNGIEVVESVILVIAVPIPTAVDLFPDE